MIEGLKDYKIINIKASMDTGLGENSYRHLELKRMNKENEIGGVDIGEPLMINHLYKIEKIGNKRYEQFLMKDVYVGYGMCILLEHGLVDLLMLKLFTKFIQECYLEVEIENT